MRFVVRDRETGNLGSIDAVVTPPSGERANQTYTKPPNGSFGSILPKPGSLCGDFYELEKGTLVLPDFWNLDAVGALYTYSLNVPDQHTHSLNVLDQPSISVEGIPGVTNRVSWFGIDYYGEFWIRAPGEYSFELFSDDGAKLYIDDELVIDLDGEHSVLKGEGRITLGVGRHTIHVPYMEVGGPWLALGLRVKPPGEKSKVFDIRDFNPPAEQQ